MQLRLIPLRVYFQLFMRQTDPPFIRPDNLWKRRGLGLCPYSSVTLYMDGVTYMSSPQPPLLSRSGGVQTISDLFFTTWLSSPTQSVQFLPPMSHLAVSSKSQEVSWIFTVFWSSRPHMVLVSQDFRSLIHLT